MREKTRKNNSSKIVKKKEFDYRIFDDQTIESLVRYYKLESPDALLRYIKTHHLTREDIEHIPTEKQSQ